MMLIGNNYRNLDMIEDNSINIYAIDKIILQANIKCDGKVILKEYEEIKTKEEELEKDSLYCSKITCTILKGTNLTIIVNKDIYIKCKDINTNTIISNDIHLGINITSSQYSINSVSMTCDNLYLHSKNLDISEINSNFICSSFRKIKLDNILKKIKNYEKN